MERVAHPEVALFGIRTMLVEPGLFRTEPLTQDSTRYAEPPLRWAAGADAIGVLEQKAQQLFLQADAYREVSSSLGRGRGVPRRGGRPLQGTCRPG